MGQPTRGTTGYNRLRRSDRWLVHDARVRTTLLTAADPLVVDLGYGALPVTTLELAARLREVRHDVRVVGLEIHPERVDAARAAPTIPGATVEFALGGFELAGMQPVLVRAFNVLRQYDVDDVAAAWSEMTSRLAPGGLIVDGTCDELGRRCCWVLLDAGGPVSLTLACDPFAIEKPSDLAERLPKVLIHHNVPGQPDARSADGRRPGMGQRGGPWGIRAAGAVARDAGKAGSRRISRRAATPTAEGRRALRAVGCGGAALSAK